MIELSESAASHFRNLIASQNIAGLGIRIRAVGAGTPQVDCQLEFCEPNELTGSEWEIECEGFSI